jgi:D-apionate oxidoisomerase
MNIALLGAGGKMGCRLTANLRHLSHYQISYVETSEERRDQLAADGVKTIPIEEVIKQAAVVVLAIPDRLIGQVTREIVPSLKSGTIVFGLDPVAPYAGLLPDRQDITYFIAHPCHPLLFSDTAPANKQSDWFGGQTALPQSVVCALFQGPEDHYAIGQKLAGEMFAPILRLHRITIEQMAILEPAVVESTMATCITVLREAMEAAVQMGVPKQAVYDFCLGHIRTELAIVFGFAEFPFSDGAIKAIEQNKPRIFREDWKNVITIPALKESVLQICEG